MAVFVLSAVIFILAFAGLSMGYILRRKELVSSCGDEDNCQCH